MTRPPPPSSNPVWQLNTRTAKAELLPTYGGLDAGDGPSAQVTAAVHAGGSTRVCNESKSKGGILPQAWEGDI